MVDGLLDEPEARRLTVRFDVFTLFPEAFDWYLGQVHIRAAVGPRPRVRPHATTATTRR